MNKTLEKMIVGMLKTIFFGLSLFALALIVLNLTGCYKSNNLIMDYCTEQDKPNAMKFYERCLNNWDKLSEYGCQVRSVENYCGARPKVRTYL
jgi:hypothetical protein